MKERKNIWIAIGILIVLLAMGLLLGQTLQEKEEKVVKNPLKVTMFKVGKADAIVLEKGSHTMVIDAGEEEDGEEVVQYLQSQGIRKIDELIITHYDKDHVGGADTLVEAFEVGQVILPDYVGQTVDYQDFMIALEEHNIVPMKLHAKMEYEVEGMHILIEPPLQYDIPEGVVEMDNNFSLITTVTDGKNKLVFMGDAEKQRVREWLAAGDAKMCDFLKVPHHGVYETELNTLFKVLQPQCAAICTSHKHPADVKTLELLKKHKVSYFETKDGNITVISDGRKLEMDQALER